MHLLPPVQIQTLHPHAHRPDAEDRVKKEETAAVSMNEEKERIAAVNASEEKERIAAVNVSAERQETAAVNASVKKEETAAADVNAKKQETAAADVNRKILFMECRLQWLMFRGRDGEIYILYVKDFIQEPFLKSWINHF